MTLSRRDPGGFHVTPVAMVGGLGAPAPHPTEIIYTFDFHPVCDTGYTICTCTDIYSAEAFEQQSSELKSKGHRGHREGTVGKRCTIGSPVGSLSVGDVGDTGCETV